MSNSSDIISGSRANSFNLGSKYSLSKTISPTISYKNYRNRWPFTEEEKWRKRNSGMLFGASDSSSS